jgi:hypothetical protein
MNSYVRSTYTEIMNSSQPAELKLAAATQLRFRPERATHPSAIQLRFPDVRQGPHVLAPPVPPAHRHLAFSPVLLLLPFFVAV